MCVWLTTTQPLDEGNDILGRCVANAVRSPILYMVPLLLAGQVLGEVAGPYVNAVNEQFNRMLQELAMRPDVQQYGQWAAIAAGVVVAGSVLYDWCTNEAGEAFTAIGPKKSTSIDDVRVGGSSLGGDRVTTVVPPVTNTPAATKPARTLVRPQARLALTPMVKLTPRPAPLRAPLTDPPRVPRRAARTSTLLS